MKMAQRTLKNILKNIEEHHQSPATGLVSPAAAIQVFRHRMRALWIPSTSRPRLCVQKRTSMISSQVSGRNPIQTTATSKKGQELINWWWTLPPQGKNWTQERTHTTNMLLRINLADAIPPWKIVWVLWFNSLLKRNLMLCENVAFWWC